MTVAPILQHERPVCHGEGVLIPATSKKTGQAQVNCCHIHTTNHEQLAHQFGLLTVSMQHKVPCMSAHGKQSVSKESTLTGMTDFSFHVSQVCDCSLPVVGFNISRLRLRLLVKINQCSSFDLSFAPSEVDGCERSVHPRPLRVCMYVVPSSYVLPM